MEKVVINCYGAHFWQPLINQYEGEFWRAKCFCRWVSDLILLKINISDMISELAGTDFMINSTELKMLWWHLNSSSNHLKVPEMNPCTSLSTASNNDIFDSIQIINEGCLIWNVGWNFQGFMASGVTLGGTKYCSNLHSSYSYSLILSTFSLNKALDFCVDCCQGTMHWIAATE